MERYNIIKKQKDAEGKNILEDIKKKDGDTGEMVVVGQKAKRGDESIIDCNSMSTNQKITTFFMSDHRVVYQNDDLYDIEFIES